MLKMSLRRSLLQAAAQSVADCLSFQALLLKKHPGVSTNSLLCLNGCWFTENLSQTPIADESVR